MRGWWVYTLCSKHLVQLWPWYERFPRWKVERVVWLLSPLLIVRRGWNILDVGDEQDIQMEWGESWSSLYEYMHNWLLWFLAMNYISISLPAIGTPAFQQSLREMTSADDCHRWPSKPCESSISVNNFKQANQSDIENEWVRFNHRDPGFLLILIRPDQSVFRIPQESSPIANSGEYSNTHSTWDCLHVHFILHTLYSYSNFYEWTIPNPSNNHSTHPEMSGESSKSRPSRLCKQSDVICKHTTSLKSAMF